MSHGKLGEKNNVLHQGYQKLEEMYHAGKGTSKHKDKATGETEGKIYSDATLKAYKHSWEDYCKAMKEDGYKAKTLTEAAEYMPCYVDKLIDRPGKVKGSKMSAWSVRTYFAGPAKILGLKAADFDLPERRREDIVRSRGEKVGDKHFSETKNAELIKFCRCTGLRNHKELQQLRGTDLRDLGGGRYKVIVRCGKGGKYREADIIGTATEVKAVVDRMLAAGNDKVWPHVHANADVHSYRADYAKSLYQSIARDRKDIPQHDRYYCRGDKKGTVYDKKAMWYVSKQLGHERTSVIAEHYL